MELEYNSSRNKLVISEYGRHIQKLVEHAVSSAKERGEWERLEVRGVDISGRPQAQPIAVGDGARVLAEILPEVRDSEDAEDAPEA